MNLQAYNRQRREFDRAQSQWERREDPLYAKDWDDTEEEDGEEDE